MGDFLPDDSGHEESCELVTLRCNFTVIWKESLQLFFPSFFLCFWASASSSLELQPTESLFLELGRDRNRILSLFHSSSLTSQGFPEFSFEAMWERIRDRVRERQLNRTKRSREREKGIIKDKNFSSRIQLLLLIYLQWVSQSYYWTPNLNRR